MTYKILISFRYRFGNFNYYQRHLSQNLLSHMEPQFLQPDTRVQIFCHDWFEKKNVLDIGCNAGIFAISLALQFNPKKVVGVDIDPHLIRAARKNVSLFVDKQSKVIF